MRIEEHVAAKLYEFAWGDDPLNPKFEDLDDTDQLNWLDRAEAAVAAVREYEAQGWVSI